ncbi:histidine phosphatase superfamily [Boletus reticuloceps]|uniref:Histidine phosphatase superfamily n=1 Tax=Boletus reticuloceps TaxID=495285 RepID=A0A8I3ADQ1_9AGAM|nr:histidine phosphatase superfamily [Boletus reticuloceps]
MGVERTGDRAGASLLVGEPLDVEGYPQALPELDLEQVHVYVRHGERTPVRTRMADPPASIPEHWQMCSVARRFSEAVNSTTTTLGEPHPDGMWFKRGTEMRDGRTVANLCIYAFLGTLESLLNDLQSTYNFGVALRRLYVDKLGFLPRTLQNENQVYFRSTNVSRTIESLEHIVHGLYPQTHCATGVIPSILVRNRVDENIVSNILSCPLLGLLELRFAEAAAARWNSRLQTLDGRLSKYLNGRPIRVDGSPRASGILDTVRSAAAHGIKVPDEFRDPEVIDLIVCPKLSIKTEKGRRLGMGRLLADVSTRMQTKIEQGDKDPLKVLVFTTHDSTLAALCSTFDAFDEKYGHFPPI